MWNSTLIKSIRWIFYIPLIWFSVVLLNYIIWNISLWIYSLSNFWILFIFLFGWGIIFQLWGIIFSTAVLFLINICPDKKVGGYIFTIISLIIILQIFYKIWTENSPKGFLIIFTILMIIFWFMFISIALNTEDLIDNNF